MRLSLPTWILAAVFVLGPAHSAFADVLIVGGDLGTSFLDNTRQELQNTGVISGTIDTFSGSNGTPTLTQLQQYTAVVCWTYYAYADMVAMGNVLADYVDGGGGVVVLQFCSHNGSFGVSGNFITQGYMPVTPDVYTSTSATLGTVDDPNHPIMQNITTVSNGGSCGLFPGTVTGTRIAAWSNGWPLVVENTTTAPGQVVFINIAGFSNVMTAWGYDPNSDAALLIANAVNYVSDNPDITLTLNGPTSTQVVETHSDGPTGDGYVLADITIATRSEEWTVTEIEFSADGTGNDATAFDELALYEDTSGSGTFEGSAVDDLATATAGVAFSANNGTYTATLTDPSFPVQTSRRFFLVGRLNGTAAAGHTFTAAVTALNATSTGGGVVDGVPTAYSDGIEIGVESLTVTRHGPTSVEQVPFDAEQQLLLDFSISAANATFTVDTLHIRALGTGNDASNYSQIALYEDSGNGTFDPGTDTLVASATAFPSDNGALAVNLTQTTFASGTQRRYFFVGSLNGTAPNGSTFGAQLESIDVSTPSSFQSTGYPTAPSFTLIVATPLTVTSVEPLKVPSFSEREITITGTGFVLPISLTIGGENALGTAVLNDSGTEITGLLTPSRDGSDLEMVLTVGGAQLLLEETFSYGSISTGSRGCGMGAWNLHWPLGLACLVMLLLAFRRRMHAIHTAV